MSLDPLTCPFCATPNSAVIESDLGLFQMRCHSCRATGPTAKTPDEASKHWSAIEQDRDLFQMLVDESPNIIIIKDWDGRFIFGNKALADLYATTPAALLGRFDKDFNPDQAQVDFYIQNAQEIMRSGKTEVIEESAIDIRTGINHHFISVKRPFTTAAGEQRILIIANDITELKSTYLQLEERERRYDEAMSIAGEGFWDWDIVHNTVTHNARWCQILGLDERSLVHTVEDFIGRLHHEHADSVMAAVKHELDNPNNEMGYQHEHMMLKASGESIWVRDRGHVVERNEQGEPLRMVGAIQDISAQKAYEFQLSDAKAHLHELNQRLAEALEQRTAELNSIEERFALAMQSTDDGLWDWDLKTNYVFYSSRWKSMLGYTDDEVDNNLDTWSQLVHSDDRQSVLNAADDYINGRTDSFEEEMRMRHKQGHHVFVRSRAFKVLDEETQEPVRLIGNHVDISDKKRSDLLGTYTTRIFEMVSQGEPSTAIFEKVINLYESRHPGLHCSIVQLNNDVLDLMSAPSLPTSFCQALDGAKYHLDAGPCAAAMLSNQRVLIADITTDQRWPHFKSLALQHNLKCCWSEPIVNASGEVLGSFAMYYEYAALPSSEELNDMIDAARLSSIIMERERNLKRIQDLAYIDSLTQLSSRASFQVHLDYRLKLCKRTQQNFSLLYLDLDNFKTVNDSLGHHAGDILLQRTAQRIKHTCREADFIGRLGGDEFCIILHDDASKEAVSLVAQRCLTAVSKPVRLEGRSVSPSGSIGIAHYPQDGDSAQSLIKAADTALYEAKHQGKNQFALYSQQLSERAELKFQIEQLLKVAIKQRQLTLAYQPQVDLASGKILGVEALSRWYHPELGQVPPDHFIEVADQLGLLKSHSEWVIATACQQVAQWSDQNHTDIYVAVNVAPCHFRDAGLIACIEKALAAANLTTSSLELEITEGAIQTHAQNQEIFSYLAAAGISVAIDDFGSGYSAFASLKHIDINVLKIDKHFIDDILSCDKASLLVRSMIDMGHSLGYRIIAEGVETLGQYEKLKQMGCDMGQGYLFSRPVTAAEISALLANDSALIGPCS